MSIADSAEAQAFTRMGRTDADLADTGRYIAVQQRPHWWAVIDTRTSRDTGQGSTSEMWARYLATRRNRAEEGRQP